MRIVVGHSDDPSPLDAADEVLEQVLAEIGDQKPVAALLYVCIDHDHRAVLDRIRARLPGIPLIGCTTDGECSSVIPFAEDSVVLSVFVSDRVTARSGIGRGLSRDADAAARAAWEAISADGEPALCIVLAESLGVSGVAIVEALNRVVPPHVPVVGGTAGDQWRFEATRQFHGDEVVQDSIVLLGLHGPLQVSVGTASGWEPMGSRARVTRASGATLDEIDGRPAIEWFQRYFGGREQPSPEHPFAVYDPPSAPSFYLRAPMRFDEGTGAIVFAADVPEGTEIRITEATRAAILGGASQAIRGAVDGFSGEPGALLVFSCAARKQVLGTRACEEVQELRSGGGVVPLAGFYTYGEIAALGRGGATRFHNETVVAVLLGE